MEALFAETCGEGVGMRFDRALYLVTFLWLLILCIVILNENLGFFGNRVLTVRCDLGLSDKTATTSVLQYENVGKQVCEVLNTHYAKLAARNSVGTPSGFAATYSQSIFSFARPVDSSDIAEIVGSSFNCELVRVLNAVREKNRNGTLPSAPIAMDVTTLPYSADVSGSKISERGFVLVVIGFWLGVLSFYRCARRNSSPKRAENPLKDA